MRTRVRIGIVIGCLVVSLSSWVGWGWYTIHSLETPITWGYAAGSAGCILTPLVLALILLAMVT